MGFGVFAMSGDAAGCPDQQRPAEQRHADLGLTKRMYYNNSLSRDTPQNGVCFCCVIMDVGRQHNRLRVYNWGLYDEKIT